MAEMRTFTVKRGKHETLEGTRVDKIKLTAGQYQVEVANLGTTRLYVGITKYIDPSKMGVKADDTEMCMPGQTLLIRWPEDGLIFLAGDGNEYSVTGTDFRTV